MILIECLCLCRGAAAAGRAATAGRAAAF
jgi:hypothetical protein